MARLRFGSGGVRIEMDDTLDRIYRRVLDRVAPKVVDRIEDATAEVFDGAVIDSPVRTGQFRRGFRQFVTVSPDHTQIRGTIVNDVIYARYVRANNLGGKSPIVELVRKPMRAKARELAVVLAADATTQLKGG